MSDAQKNGTTKQTRYLSQAIQLEEAVNPHIIKSTMVMISLAILAFLVWAGFANINEVARAPGEVVPQGNQQMVQHLEGGIIKSIHVQEGDIVKKGDILFVMNGGGLYEDLSRSLSKQTSLELQEERLRAFTEGREARFIENASVKPKDESLRDQKAFLKSMRQAREKEKNIIDDQILQRQKTVNTLRVELETAQSSLAIAEDLFERRRKLNAKGYASDIQILESRQRVIDLSGQVKQLKNRISVAQTELAEYRRRLSSLSASQVDRANEKLDVIIADKNQNRGVIEKLQERIARLNIRAPADGMAKGVNVNTVGGVIKPGETLLEIVPMDKTLEVRVKISPQDIGHLKLGQPVQVKFSTFNFSRYGSALGHLAQISATTFSGKNGERFYRGKVLLEKNYVGDNPANVILPGMTVMADIITGEKTILQYLLKPIRVSLNTAFQER